MTSVTVWSIRLLAQRFALLGLLLLAVVCPLDSEAQQTDSAKVVMAVEKQLMRYPESTLCDIYKSFFQDEYGPGHLIADSATAAERLRSEIDQMSGSQCPLYELTGSSGNFYRVSLEVITEGYITFEAFLSAFLRSAELALNPEVGAWSKRWEQIERLIFPYAQRIHSYEQCRETIALMLSQNRYVMGHSKPYNQRYHPHYRLIHRLIFEKELLPLLR